MAPHLAVLWQPTTATDSPALRTPFYLIFVHFPNIMRNARVPPELALARTKNEGDL